MAVEAMFRDSGDNGWVTDFASVPGLPEAYTRFTGRRLTQVVGSHLRSTEAGRGVQVVDAGGFDPLTGSPRFLSVKGHVKDSCPSYAQIGTGSSVEAIRAIVEDGLSLPILSVVILSNGSWAVNGLDLAETIRENGGWSSVPYTEGTFKKGTAPPVYVRVNGAKRVSGIRRAAFDSEFEPIKEYDTLAMSYSGLGLSRFRGWKEIRPEKVFEYVESTFNWASMRFAVDEDTLIG